MLKNRIGKYALILLVVINAMFLCSCGVKQYDTPEVIEVINYTLPDIEAFKKDAENAEAESKQEKAKASEELTYVKWIPGGVYTYNTGNSGSGSEDTWSMALFKIQKVDISAHTAVVSYIIKDMRGFNEAVQSGKNVSEDEYFLSSDGIIAFGCDEFEQEGGIRTIKIYLENDRWLEFSGGNKIETAAYFHKDKKYNLKSEG